MTGSNDVNGYVAPPVPVGEELWLDRWKHPSGDIVYLPSTNVWQYRLAGFVLLESHAVSLNDQADADIAESRWHGIRLGADANAPFPAA
jgi:hypothetical protein